MKYNYVKKISIFMMFLFTLNLITPQVVNGLYKNDDIERYILEGDPFDRSFIGGIKQNIEAKLDNFKNKNSQSTKSTIYQDIEIDKISINGTTLTKEYINNNVQKFKELYKERNRDEGFENIKIITKDKSKYDYGDYLKIRAKNVQPINITSNTTWTKEKGPYYIGGEIRVLNGATLIIEAGTDIYFYDTPLNTSKNGILVDGKLVIKGTSNNRVNLMPMGETTYPGAWKGIYVTERGSLSASYTNIDKAGAWSDSAVYALGELNLNNCNITNTLGNGIRAFRDVNLANNNIKNNTLDGINIYRTIYDYSTIITSNNISGNNLAGRIVFNDASSSNYNVVNNTTTNNTINGFKLSGTINGNTTFTDIGPSTPYVLVNMDDNYNILENFRVKEKSKVIFDKCVVKVEDNPKTYKKNSIEVDGAIEFIGNETKRVILTSSKDNSIYGDTTNIDGNEGPKNNDWTGINVSDTGTIKANYMSISYADKAISSLGDTIISNSNIKNTSTGINTKGRSMSITNSNFSNIDRYAFDYNMNDENMDLTLTGNRFENIKSEIGRINLVNSGGSNFIASNNTTSNNTKNGVVLSGSIGRDMSIKHIGDNIPYIIPNLKVNEGTVVDVAAGTILKIEDGTMLGSKSGIISYGVLNLKGTSKNKVIITSLKDDSIAGDTNGDGVSKGSRGDWGSISYKDNKLSVINYADIKYGGDLKDDFMVGGSGALSITNSNIKYSSQNGIKSSGNITVDSSTISNNDLNGVEVDKILNISSSTIANNKNHGIEASGELNLNNSNINANGRHGLNIINENGSNFKLNLVGNTFRDNKEYAAFSKFNHDNDRIIGNNNVGINNSINGIGISGEIGANVTLEPAGDEFPFVVPDEVRVKEGKIVTLLDGLTMKFGENAKFDLSGKIDVRGIDSNKVTFTSLKDDSIAGDTNNDGSINVPTEEDNEGNGKLYSDWNGIIYNDGSEGIYENFICKFSYYNMDYKNIPNVKVVKKGDSQVSISENKAAYIRDNGNEYAVYLYDYETKKAEIISSNSNRKKEIMISGNYIAWIEDNDSNNIAIYNISTKNKQYINAINVENLYLNDGYISWTEGSQLHYKAVNSSNIHTLEKTVDSTFKPVISSDYIIYKGLDDMVYRIDLKDSNKEYYMLTSTTQHQAVDMYGDNIAFLTKDEGASSSNIIAGDIPTWTAMNVTDNFNINNSNLSLYKDKIMYFNRNINKNIIVKSSNSSNKLTNTSVLTTGYFVNSNDIGNESAIFTDDDKVYLLETKFTNNKNEFVTGKLDSKTGYDRILNLGNSLNISLGGKLGLDDVLDGGISFNAGKESNLSYGAKRNTYGQNTDIGIGRELIHTSGLDTNIDIGIGKVVEIGGSLSAGIGGLKKNSDEYYFKPSEESYRDIAMLTASGILNNISNNTVSNLIMRKLDESLKSILDIKDKSTSYDTRSGLGANWNGEVEAGISASILKSSMGASLSTSAIGEVGASNENSKYVSFTSAYADNFSINAGLDIDIPTLDDILLGESINQNIFELNILPKLPDFIDENKSKSIEYTIKVTDDNVEISFKDGEELSNGYIKEHRYKTKISNLDSTSPLGKRVHSINRNFDNLDSTLSIQKYNVYGDSIFSEIQGLTNLLNSKAEVTYELVISKSNESYLEMEFDTELEDEDEDKDENKDENKEKAIPIVPTAGVSLKGNKEDIIEVVVDSSLISNGKVKEDNLKIVFIPVNDKLIDTELKNIFRSLYKEINPVTIDYINSVADYSNKAKIKSSNDLSYAIYMDVPVKDFKNGEFKIDDNKSIIQSESIYVESFDADYDKVAIYPEESTLEMKIDNWNEFYKNNYAIYEYHAETDSWTKLGGKIDEISKTITIPINHNGEYAIGIDKSEPNIIWSHNLEELEFNDTVLEGETIVADIVESDNIDSSSIRVTVDSEAITNYKINNKSIEYVVPSDREKFTIEVYYEDEYGNPFSKSITLLVAKKSIDISQNNEIVDY